LRAALDLSRRVPATVEKAEAPEWLVAQLQVGRAGVATVVYHSLVMQYLSQVDQARVQRALAEAGARATPSATLAWLRMEHGSGDVEVRLTAWPRGKERLLATAANHGRRVNWLLN